MGYLADRHGLAVNWLQVRSNTLASIYCTTISWDFITIYILSYLSHLLLRACRSRFT